MGKYQITRNGNGYYQFRLLSSNGQVVLTSEVYTTRNSCENAIQTLKNSSQYESSFVRKTSSKGYYYFVVKANNGSVIGSSDMYASESGRESGIYSVKTNALSDQVEY